MISFQHLYGSLAEISYLKSEIELSPAEDIPYIIEHIQGYDIPPLVVSWRYFIHNLGFIMLSIACGVALGITDYLLMDNKRIKTK